MNTQQKRQQFAKDIDKLRSNDYVLVSVQTLRVVIEALHTAAEADPILMLGDALSALEDLKINLETKV